MIFLICFASHAKCSLQTYSSDYINSAIKDNGYSVKDFERICSKINSANARVYITGGFLTLDGKNVATITVHILDANSMLVADGNYNTYVTINNVADDGNKSRMISQTIDKAIAGWDVDAAIASLNIQRKKRIAAFQAKS